MNESKHLNLNSLKKSQLSEEKQRKLPKISKKLSATKQKTQEICFALASSSERFDPANAVSLIQKLLHSEDYLSRILYSEFSIYLFSLDEQGRGTFDTNVEALLQYVSTNDTEEKIVEFVIRIYDHCQLAKAQIENIDNMLKERIEEAKRNIETESKKLEKEYISILGIFAAVVLAFMGGSMFSTSVLENMGSTNIYRLIFIVDFLAFAVISLVYLLVTFIMKINGTSRLEERLRRNGKKKKRGFFSIKMVYAVCLSVALLDIAAWAVDFKALIEFIAKEIHIPWIS